MQIRRRATWAISLLAAAMLVFGAQAAANTTAGNTCAADQYAPNETLAALAGDPTSALAYDVPSSGVITSWTLNDGFSKVPAGASIEQQLKVFRRTSDPKALQVVGESSLVVMHVGLNTSQTRIPVEAGDLVGNGGLGRSSGEPITVALYCPTGKPDDQTGVVTGNPVTGSPAKIVATQEEIAVPMLVTVEADADGDGYGDETQDQCPADVTVQGPCAGSPPPSPPGSPTSPSSPTPPGSPTPPSSPAPPALPTTVKLSAAATAKRGQVAVTVTASAQASVSIGGNVKLGKGKAAKLSGGTQIVTPGALAKFTVPFPAKLKAALKGTPKGKKLTLNLSASAPGATTEILTVKVPGQEVPPRRSHRL